MNRPRAQRNRTLKLCAAALWFVAAAAAPLPAQDRDALPISDFVAQQAKWPRLQGTMLKVEGRKSGLNEDRLLYEKCDLLFIMGKDVSVPKSLGKSVQVTGTLQMRQGKLVFNVSRLKELPTDAEVLMERRGRLPPDEAPKWYALAEWAEQRGRFYEDTALLADAADLRRSGIMIEYRKIAVNDIPGLYALAQKVEKLDLPPELRDEIRHDALRRELRALKPNDAKQHDVVLTHLLGLSRVDVPLPTAAGVLTDEVQTLRQRYTEQPLEVYQQADQTQRQLLHRVLYVQAMLERIELDAAADGSNGYQIAKRIEDSLPESQDRAAAYREREIEWQLAHVPELTRDQLLLLTSRLEESDPPRTARATEEKRHWLTSREAAYRKRGAGGLLDLAQDYVTLLEDRETAATIYMEMFKDRAGQETARGRLVELGYQFDGSEWTKAAAEAQADTADAIRMGIVRIGMTSDQVRSAFGRPASVVKFAVRGQVSELWVFPDHGVAVEFSRRGAEGVSKAVQVSRLGP